MQETVCVLVVVLTRDRMRGWAGSVTSTTITSLLLPTWLGSVGEYSTVSAPTRTNRLMTPSMVCSP